MAPHFASADLTVSSLPQSSMVPGGIAIIPTGVNAISGSYREERILLANYNENQYAIIGIPLNANLGSHQFALELVNGQRELLQFVVKDKEYVEQHITCLLYTSPSPRDRG